ncbi:hypothetical protein Purlil1_13728 [Purpureocillium lilacinum]|uniref:Uncharacterized protein n=1 Tax=Purpureocillium lilacinum TaxID=33203 RepID=A0ABR0BDB5_PURLI|nr:hypothetical protein Purlil1_13728 [Purpureocillium lilacinum]
MSGGSDLSGNEAGGLWNRMQAVLCCRAIWTHSVIPTTAPSLQDGVLNTHTHKTQLVQREDSCEAGDQQVGNTSVTAATAVARDAGAKDTSRSTVRRCWRRPATPIITNPRDFWDLRPLIAGMSDQVGFAVTPEPDMLQTPTSGRVGAGQGSHAAHTPGRHPISA